VLSLIDSRATGAAAQPDDTDPVWTPTWEARAAAFGGRVGEAHRQFGRAIENALAANLRDLAAQWTVEDAELDALVARCDVARRRVADGLAVSRDNFTLERGSRTLALCGDGTGASGLSAELLQRFPEAVLTRSVQIPTIEAALSLRRNDSARAVKLLEPVRPYDPAPSTEFWTRYLRGESLLRSKDTKAAAQEFSALVAHRGEAPLSPLFALAHLGLGRASAADGDHAAARDAYDRFFTLWVDADEDLPVLAEARREYALLQPRPR
jgi:tetratricopeptide (TPR) repeat protein